MASGHEHLVSRLPVEQADLARLLLKRLGGDDLDFADLCPSDVRGVLWLYLPRRWPVEPVDRPAVAEVFARLLELAGRPTLAALARDPLNQQVFAAYERSEQEGIRAAHRAFARTGTTPPDTALLTWSSAPVSEEVFAFGELFRLLDTEVAAGTYAPNAPDWREKRTELTERWLTTPAESFQGRTPLESIRLGRLARWGFAGPPQRYDLTAGAVAMLAGRAKSARWRPDEAALAWLGTDDLEVAVAELISVAMLSGEDVAVGPNGRTVLTFVALAALEPVLRQEQRRLPPYRLTEASVLRWMDYGVGRGYLRSDSGRTECVFTEEGRRVAVEALAARAFGPRHPWPWPVPSEEPEED